jgi:hypothetical protein
MNEEAAESPPLAGRTGCEIPFTDPRIAFEGDQPRLPRRHAGDNLCYPGEFRRTADEKVERHLPVLHGLSVTRW